MDNNFKYTCLFGGGAIRGVSYIGAVKALEELGIIPDRLAGSSVGSILQHYWQLATMQKNLKIFLLRLILNYLKISQSA